ncbi:putative Down syndrome cell adhesion molecule-like protein Dscam2 [Penaeus vannamei]|uniref:Putative Down syndrome cell adhesion molecule-like protein Dscam2 n=1 Tax=Penaeus vannamei TaxID=6689 RepID=A0A3R7QG05_PENVA|nr:putative Down syndrome cell adhesion molecule-like protein Dscam2 [Penaeus vannamei]
MDPYQAVPTPAPQPRSSNPRNTNQNRTLGLHFNEVLSACVGISLHQPDATAGPLSELKVHRVRGTNPTCLVGAGRLPPAAAGQFVLGSLFTCYFPLPRVNSSPREAEDGPATQRASRNCPRTEHKKAVDPTHVNITSVRAEDGGAYTCTATNRAGTVAHQARLNVYGPAYVRAMSVVTAVAGEELVVSCPAAGYPLAQLTWSKDGRTLPVMARQKVYENGTLVVSRVEKSRDGGSYTPKGREAIVR